MCLFHHCIVLVLISAFFISIGRSQSPNTCKVLPFGERETNRLSNLFRNLSQYIHENDLQTGHSSLRKVLAELKADVQVQLKMPLEAYLMKYHKSLHDEVTLKLTTLTDRMLDKMDVVFSQREIQQDKMHKQIESLMEIVKCQVNNTLVASVSRDTSSIVNISTSGKPSDNILKPSDCSDLLINGTKTSGVYTIYPSGYFFNIGVKVYCDMESNGGGWTVFVNRLMQTTAENFNRTWEQYKEGFGNASNEYWMGNEALYTMTNSRDYTLRVDASIESEGLSVWGEWAHFKVQSEDDKYKLSVSGYDASSSMVDRTITYHHGMYFSTLDRDNDKWGQINCAAVYGGAFWYNACSRIYATASYLRMYLTPWSVTDSTTRRPSHLQMKIRPRI